MGGGASAQTSQKYENYYQTVVFEELEETLLVLDYTREHGSVLYHSFREIDADNSGEISVSEFHDYLGVQQTRFSTRVFGVLDTDASGFIDLKEFVVGIWNWCTYDVRLLAKFAFSLFDVDHTGSLSIYECDALIRMLYDSDEADPELLALLNPKGEGTVTTTEFIDIAEANPQLVQPPLDMQRQVRQQFFGVRYWEKQTRKRQKEFAAFDSLQNDARQSITEIVLIKSRKRQAELQRLKDERKRIADALNEVEEKELEEEIKIQEEIQEMHREAETEVVESHFSQEEDEKQSWANLKALFVELRKPYSFEQLDEKRQLRHALWNQYDNACECAQKTLELEEQQRLNGAEVEGRKHGKDTLKSEKGARLIEFSVTSRYCKKVGKRWEEGTPMQRLLAPLLIPESDWQIPLGARILCAVSTDPALKSLRQEEEDKIIEDCVLEEIQRAEKENAKARAAREADMREVQQDFHMYTGRRDTKWERLYHDPFREASVYYWNSETEEVREGDCAICENCDSLLEDADKKCFDCGQERSARNRQLYKP